MYPGTKVTKGTLAAYYAAVAEKMLPHIQDRPLSLVRDTDGDLQKTFFQKHKLPGMPKAIHDGQLEKMSGKESRILWVDDLAGLIGGVQMNVLEFHVWGSSCQEPNLPHRMIFDIDPDEGLGFTDVKQAALDIRGVLEALGLKSWPLLSGGKGVHVVVPLVPQADWDEVKSFCQNFAELLARTDPSRFIANMSKAKRKGRMFIDYLRNGQGATAICPWSTRARAGATCAVPVTWDELPSLKAPPPSTFLPPPREHRPRRLGRLFRRRADADGPHAQSGSMNLSPRRSSAQAVTALACSHPVTSYSAPVV